MKRPSLKTIAICFVLFFVFLVWRFPYRNLRGYVFEQIYKNTGIRVDAHDFYPVFLGWPGLRFSKTSVNIPLNRLQSLDFSCDLVTARVGLAGVLPPTPSVSLYLEGLSKGGDVFAKLSPSSTQISGSASLGKVKLDQFVLPWFPEPISGTVTAGGKFFFPNKDFSQSQLDFTLASDKLVVPGQNLQGIILPRIELQKVDAKITTKEGAFVIDKFTFGSQDSDLRGNFVGNLKLGPTLDKSFLSLVVRLQLSEKYKADPNSATLVSFLSTFQTSNPGEYALKWAATLGDMQTNLILAIPQRPE